MIKWVGLVWFLKSDHLFKAERFSENILDLTEKSLYSRFRKPASRSDWLLPFALKTKGSYRAKIDYRNSRENIKQIAESHINPKNPIISN
jgi:hypothetical protein